MDGLTLIYRGVALILRGAALLTRGRGDAPQPAPLPPDPDGDDWMTGALTDPAFRRWRVQERRRAREEAAYVE